MKEYPTHFLRSFLIGYDDDENMQIDTNIDALQFKPDLPPPYVTNEVLKSSIDQIKKAELEEIESLPEVTGIKI